MSIYGPDQDFQQPFDTGQMGEGMVSYLNPHANHPSQVPEHGVIDAQAQQQKLFQTPPMPDFNSVQQRVMAQQSPYLSMPANGWLQNNHPQVAGRLDAALAAIAHTGTGTTTAQNIIGAAQGVIGGHQAEQQHAVEQALLPLHMGQQQMAYQQGLLNLYKTGADIQHLGAESDYLHTHGSYLNARAEQLGQATGNVIIDDNGEPWAQGKAGQGLQYAGDNPRIDENYQPTFNKKNQSKTGTGGGFLGSNINAATDPNASPEQQARAKANLNLYSNVQGNVAGNKAGAVNQANDPKTRAEEFQKSEIASQVEGLGKRPTPAEQKEFQANELMKQVLAPNAKVDMDSIPSLDTRQKEFDAKMKDLKSRAGNYVKSGDAKKGVKFDPSVYGDVPKQASTPQTPPASGQPDLNSALDRIFPRQ